MACHRELSACQLDSVVRHLLVNAITCILPFTLLIILYPGYARAQTITLTFEGLQDTEAILNYYNGGLGGFGSGPGPNYGIIFGSDAIATIAQSAGGGGYFSGNPSGVTIATFLSGPGVVMNVPGGFTSGFSFYYTSGPNAGIVTVYDGPNATGNLLATVPLEATGQYCNGSQYVYSCWMTGSVPFSGVAQSVDFSGATNMIGFDNITLGSQTPGGGSTGSNGPVLTVTPSVSGSTTTTNPMIISQPVTVTNSGGSGSFTASIQSSFPDLFSICPQGQTSCSQPTSGTIGGSGSTAGLSVNFNTAGVPPGIYTATYMVTAADSAARAGGGLGILRSMIPRATTLSNSGTTTDTVNGVLVTSPPTLTLNLGSPQTADGTLTVMEAASNVIPVNISYSGQPGPIVNVNTPSGYTPDAVSVQALIGTLAPGTNATGALSITCTSSMPCSNTPVAIPVNVIAPATTSTTKSLPHFAVGQGFVSDFYVVNSGTSTANFSIAFHDSNGNPIALPFASGSVSTLSGTIDAGGAGYYEAAGTQGTLLSGSALITSDPGITIQALFRRLGSDGSYYEAAVPAATGSNEIQVPFDDTTFTGNGSQIYTGLAIANLDTSNSANLSCTAKDSDGNPIANAISAPMLNPLGHWANYLFQPLVGQRGTIDCKSNTQIGAIGIRALGANALSSLPIITFPLSTTGGTSVLPHFAVGQGFVSDFYVVNSSSSTANFSIAFHDSNGNPIALPFASGSVSTLSGSIDASGAGYYEAAGTQGTLLSGSALITSDPGITIQALFRRLGSDGSYYEAAVPAATGSNEIQVPFDDTTFTGNGSQIYTGLAIANLDTSNSANLSCTAKDSDGNPIANAISAPMLNPLGHWANYLFQPLVGQRGTIDCKSNTQIGAIGIRALGGNALSSLPVIVIAP